MLKDDELFSRAAAELEARIRLTVKNFLIERLKDDQENVADVINLLVSCFVSSMRNTLYKVSKGTDARKDVERIINQILLVVQKEAFEMTVKITREKI